MRDYGFGKREDTLESTVAHEIKEMIDMSINGPQYPAEKVCNKFQVHNLLYYDVTIKDDIAYKIG